MGDIVDTRFVHEAVTAAETVDAVVAELAALVTQPSPSLILVSHVALASQLRH